MEGKMQAIIHEASAVNNIFGVSGSNKTVIPIARILTPPSNTDEAFIGNKCNELFESGYSKKTDSINLKTRVYMSVDTIEKIIQRFLVEIPTSKEKLTKILGISVKELEQLCAHEASLELIQKIIRLYCETKWA